VGKEKPSKAKRGRPLVPWTLTGKNTGGMKGKGSGGDKLTTADSYSRPEGGLGKGVGTRKNTLKGRNFVRKSEEAGGKN